MKLTHKRLIRACKKAISGLARDKKALAIMVSAGFIFKAKQVRGQRKGTQIFVKACAYDDAVLERNAQSGGLLVNDPTSVRQ